MMFDVIGCALWCIILFAFAISTDGIICWAALGMAVMAYLGFREAIAACKGHMLGVHWRYED